MKDINTLKKMIGQLNYILGRKQKVEALGVFLIIIVGSLLEMIGVSALLPFLQALLSPNKMMEGAYAFYLAKFVEVHDYIGLISVLSLLIILVYLIKNIVQTLSVYFQCLYKNKLLKQLSLQMLESYLDREYDFFVNTNSGEVLRGITTDSAGVHDIMETLFKFISEILTIFFIGIYLIYMDAILALSIMLIGCSCLLLIVYLSKREVSKSGKIGRDAIAENLRTASEIVAGVKDIFVTQTKERFIRKYSRTYDKRVIASITYEFAASLPERIIETISVLGILGVVIIRINSGTAIETFAPVLFVFVAAAVRLMPSLSRIAGYITTFVFYRPTLEVAYENIMEARSIKYNTIEKFGQDVCEITFNNEIVIENLDWQYSCLGPKILRNFSLKIKKGDAIGIIGESGAGKSTISDILLGLYRPQKGRLMVDGKDIYINPFAWSGMIGYVSQSIFLIDDTIRNNIIFERNKNNDDDDRVWAVLKMAKLDDFVKSLPDHLDTIVGERGIKFSGGQRQRIAIARALYSNPSILILDEATSALDNETENAVMETIDALQGKKTLIIIAHRLTTLKNCNRIVEIKDGQAIEKNKKEVLEGRNNP